MIYIMRHGETDENKNAQRQGWENSHINQNGRRQAVLTGRWLKDKHIDMVISSDLTRAVETCNCMNMQPTTSQNLRERNWGMEDANDVAERAYRFLGDIQNLKDHNILIVTHGNTARHLIAQLEGTVVSKIPALKNCEVRWASNIQMGLFGENYLTDWLSWTPETPSR